MRGSRRLSRSGPNRQMYNEKPAGNRGLCFTQFTHAINLWEEPTMKQTIAFFGLGAMGEPMAANLLGAGYAVRTAIHRSRDAAGRLAGQGLALFTTPAEAVSGVDIVVTILPADPEIKEFLINEEFAAAMKPGTVIVDMSSCTSACIRDVEAFYAAKGVPVIDAPVSGGVDGAAAGTLTIFGSGEQAAFDAVRPILGAMGREIYFLGGCGTGKAFKNLNNLLSVINTAVTAEMARIAVHEGLDLNLLYDVINASTGASVSFKARFKRMTAGNYEGGFQLGLARKDLANAIALGNDLPLPLAKLAHDILLSAKAYDKEDMAAVYKYFE